MRAVLAVCKLTDEEYMKGMHGVGSAITMFKDRTGAPPAARRRHFYILALLEPAQ